MLFPTLKQKFFKALCYEAVLFGLEVFMIGKNRRKIAVVFKRPLYAERAYDYLQTTRKEVIYQDTRIMEEKNITPKNVANRNNHKSRPTQRYYVPPAQRVLNKGNINFCEMEKTDINPSALSNSKEVLHYNGDCVASQKHMDVFTGYMKEEMENITTGDFVSDEPIASERIKYDIMCGSNLLPKPDELIPEYKNNDTKHIYFSKSEGNLEASYVDTTSHSTEIIKPHLFDIYSELPQDTSILSLQAQIKAMSLENQEYINIKDEGFKRQIHFYKDEDDHLSTGTDVYFSFTTNDDKYCMLKDNSDNEEEIQQTIENINRLRKPLIKHVRSDDILRIESNERPEDLNSYSSINNRSMYCSTFDSYVKETNLSNWEDMFDENGDLQKEYVGEITKHIGSNVKILKATNDYSLYQNIDQDLDHVIELYDFPSSFKTQDIMHLYSDAHQDAMYVKWCDDTHALLVLSTPAQAKRALQIEHRIVKSRPMKSASKIASKVASCSDLKPAMKRPQTNMQTARRLINSHLGTKIKLSKEVLEQEQKALVTAREQKRIERQNRKDAWEGNPRSTKLV